MWHTPRTCFLQRSEYIHESSDFYYTNIAASWNWIRWVGLCWFSTCVFFCKIIIHEISTETWEFCWMFLRITREYVEMYIMENELHSVELTRWIWSQLGLSDIWAVEYSDLISFFFAHHTGKYQEFSVFSGRFFRSRVSIIPRRMNDTV